MAQQDPEGSDEPVVETIEEGEEEEEEKVSINLITLEDRVREYGGIKTLSPATVESSPIKQTDSSWTVIHTMFLKDEDEVFEENHSLFFKELHVVRFYDKPNNTLVYLSYSDRVIEGSPKNSISTVPIMPWGNK